MAKKLVICDLDGTLISPYMDNPDRDFNTWHVLPDRKEKLAALRNDHVEIAIATNQAGVGLGFVTEQHARNKFKQAMADLGIVHCNWLLYDQAPASGSYVNIGVVSVHVCYNHVNAPAPYDNPDRRKPQPAMLLEAMHMHNVQPDNTIMVGDSAEDRAAAERAGISFIWADDYFGAYERKAPGPIKLPGLDDLYRE